SGLSPASPSGPPPASRPASPATAADRMSQPLASARDALVTDPSVFPPASAVTATLTTRPVGYVEKSSSRVPWGAPADGSVTYRGVVATPSMMTTNWMVSVWLGQSMLSSTVPA